ncbi:glycosyltransferase family 9 protein [Dictyobacter arantiisoli]|uniref:LPS biosynthesis-related glycosyltransferase n=1 Tax=Dictyobacter arantiisoli TaxID=2014874 RepID=A0A5A5TB47_9CHLR|nr:glycosyltransferase family 9 protein [Dictyobacter arantiisoli]GCF08720.1 LPS biosynthesis-related glycosyltransferase [Dictyobacter arantiisoli]
MEYRYQPEHIIRHADRIPDVKKIAVLRANALGDFIFVLPALQALHHTYPEAEIVLLAKAWCATFMQARPSPIDRVIVVPPFGGVSEEPGYREDPLEMADFFAKMEQEHFDLACQFHGGGRYSNPFIQQLGARITIGLRAEDAPALDRWLPYILLQHEVVRYQEVASLVGAPRESYLIPQLTVTREDLAASFQLVPEERTPLAVLHPGASDPRRRWPADKFASVGDALVAAGAQILVTGNEAEKDLTASVVEQMHAPARDLGGKLSLKKLTGLLARSHILVSNDTGPRHLADAIGTPTVGIYWCFNMITASPLTRERNLPLVSWQTDCPLCGESYLTKNCQHQASIVSNITTDEVIQAALKLFTAQA